MSLPYLPLFVDDYEADTAHLSLAEDGLYNRLLRLCWRTPRCRMPNDIEWIARKVRISTKAERAALDSVLAEFFTVRKGVIFSKRLAAEYERASDTSKKRSEAGKNGNRAKSLKTNETDGSRASAGRTHPYPYPEPDKNLPVFNGAQARKNPTGFVKVRRTTDAINDFLQELNDDEGRVDSGSESHRSDVPMLPAVRAG